MIENEKKHWNAVLTRLFAIVQSLAERCLAFRGHSDRLYTPHNGNLLATVELFAKFDPVLCEHLRRIRDKKIFDTYLGKYIQNEMIDLVAETVMNKIISSVKKAKYFSTFWIAF